jgi:hypothetical protein
MKRARTAYALCLLAPLGACGDDAGSLIDAAIAADANGIDAAPPREQIMETQTLQPGQLVEGVMTGGPTDLALLHLEAPAEELDWNIHGHPDNMTIVVYEELNRMTVDYSYTPSAQGEWYLLVRNSGPTSMDVLVRVGLYANMQWRWE